METLENLHDYTDADKIEAAVEASDVDNPFFALKNICDNAEAKFGEEFSLKKSPNDWDGQSFENKITWKFWEGTVKDTDNYLEKMSWEMMDQWRDIRDTAFDNGRIGRWFRGWVDIGRWKKNSSRAEKIRFDLLSAVKAKSLRERLDKERRDWSEKLAEQTREKLKKFEKKSDRKPEMDAIITGFKTDQYKGIDSEPPTVRDAFKKLCNPDGIQIEAVKRFSTKKETIVSYDFRHHPEIESIMTILETAWKDYPETDTRRKTLELLKLAVAHQKKMKDSGETDFEMALIYQNEKPILCYGVEHTSSYYETHKEYFKKIFSYTDQFIVETAIDTPGVLSLDATWKKTSSRSFFANTTRDFFAQNKDGKVCEIDARNIHKGSTDFYGRKADTWLGTFAIPFETSDIPMGFANKKFNYLSENYPLLAEKIGSPEKLKEAMEKQGHIMEALLAKLTATYNHNGIQIIRRPSLRNIPTASKYFAEVIQGLLSVNDAMHALKMHRWAKLQPGAQTFVDLEGAVHTEKVKFFHNPALAARVVEQSPEYLHQAEILSSGTFRKEHLDNIQKFANEGYITKSENDKAINELAAAFTTEYLAKNFDFSHFETVIGDPWEFHTGKLSDPVLDKKTGYASHKLDITSYDFTGKEIDYSSMLADS